MLTPGPLPSDPNSLSQPAPFSHTLVTFIYSYILSLYIKKRANLPEEKLLKNPSGSGSLLYPRPQKFFYKIFQCDLQETHARPGPPRPGPSVSPRPRTAPSSGSAPGGIQSHLWPSTAAMAFCWEPPCCAPGGHVGCGWWRWWRLWAVGDDGGIQVAWWLGGDEAQKGLKFAGGEQATAVMGLLALCRPSEARSLENMARASGKLGGVAGVLLGVHIC